MQTDGLVDTAGRRIDHQDLVATRAGQMERQAVAQREAGHDMRIWRQIDVDTCRIDAGSIYGRRIDDPRQAALMVGMRRGHPMQQGDGDDGAAGEQQQPHDDDEDLERPEQGGPISLDGGWQREDFVATEAEAGERLDRLTATRLDGVSRSRIKALIEGGRVTLDGVTITNPSARVKPGQAVAIGIPPAEDPIPEAQDIPLTILHEDAALLVIDKPAGLVVHPAPGNPDMTLVNAVLGHCGASLQGIGGVRRPGIVHRIDKDTSGLMVIAKTSEAHLALAEQFSSRTIERAYQAVVWGVPSPREGTIDRPIGRHPQHRQRMAVVANGKPAITGYKVLRPLGLDASLVECRLRTGRTHQIRVHMTVIGNPLIGDPVYGRPPAAARRAGAGGRAPPVSFGRQALHAYLLGFLHPTSGQMMRFETGLPQDIAELVRTLE